MISYLEHFLIFVDAKSEIKHMYEDKTILWVSL